MYVRVLFPCRYVSGDRGTTICTKIMLVSIDPGKSGAYALFESDGTLIETIKVKTPSKQRFFGEDQTEELKGLFYTGLRPEGYPMAVMEGLLDRHMPKQSAVATNTTAVNWGMQYMVCMDWGEGPPDVVRPVTWKTKLGLSGKDKSASVELARELVDPAFLRKPRMRVDNVDIAEAILIGIYYGRKELGWTI